MEGFFLLWWRNLSTKTNTTYGKASLADILFQKLFSMKKSAKNVRFLPKPAKSSKSCEKLKILRNPGNPAPQPEILVPSQKVLPSQKCLPGPQILGPRTSNPGPQKVLPGPQILDPRCQTPSKTWGPGTLRPLYATNFWKNARPWSRPKLFFLGARIRGTEKNGRDSAKTPQISTVTAKKRVFWP